jgi:hypothetical protein
MLKSAPKNCRVAILIGLTNAWVSTRFVHGFDDEHGNELFDVNSTGM